MLTASPRSTDAEACPPADVRVRWVRALTRGNAAVIDADNRLCRFIAVNDAVAKDLSFFVEVVDDLVVVDVAGNIAQPHRSSPPSSVTSRSTAVMSFFANFGPSSMGARHHLRASAHARNKANRGGPALPAAFTERPPRGGDPPCGGPVREARGFPHARMCGLTNPKRDS
jgi:hypothetical protein